MSEEIYANDALTPIGPQGLYVKPKVSTKDVVIRDRAGRILYACMGIRGTLLAVEHVGPEYYSASDQASALFQFVRHHPGVRFAAILAAPAVGFFVHDNHGDKLSADGARKDGAGK